MKLKLVIFSGGRGTTSIVEALLRHDQTSVTSIVNAYDDGLSTGRIRSFVKGMLGPSDIRKNIATLMPTGERPQRALRQILEHRLPAGTTREDALGSLRALADLKGVPTDRVIAAELPQLTIAQARSLSAYARAFLDFEADELQKGRSLDYDNSAVGNILFAGCFLLNNRDFNLATAELSALCELRGQVLNATTGENLVLVGLDEAGNFIRDESSVVSPRTHGQILEVYLFEHYLNPNEVSALSDLSFVQRKDYMHGHAKLPSANPAVLDEIRSADVILYGPGTQHSSLFPTYLTQGIAEEIAKNERAEKIFIANITPDHDIGGETVKSLLKKFLYYINRYDSLNYNLKDLVTQVIANAPDRSASNDPGSQYVPLDLDTISANGTVIKTRNWEGGAGRHLGGMIVGSILQSLPAFQAGDIRTRPHMASIVVPVLDEAKTLHRVLSDLKSLDFSDLGLSTEIIVVDGGSTDGSVEIAAAFDAARSFRMPRGVGRGEAFRHGAEHAKGDILVLFPADNEYSADDIRAVIEPIVERRHSVVFGSRLIKCIDMGAQIRYIYGQDRLGFILSKYGGILISVVSLLIYNRYVTDALSTLKAYDKTVLDRLNLVSNGLSLEGEIIAKLSKRKEFILEVPVAFSPRKRAEGKKMRARDGLGLIWALIKFRDAGA